MTQAAAALAAFREVSAGQPLTDERIAALRHLTQDMVEAEDIERLKRFARDTADINSHLLADIESGTVRPSPHLMELVDWYEKNKAALIAAAERQAEGQIQLSLFVASHPDGGSAA